MKEEKTISKVAGNLVLFSALIYLIISSQKNLGLAEWIANSLGTESVRPIGVGIMITALIGILLQLYCYNKTYQ
ncbi:MAG: hypothetical protein K0S71_2 [Clostridia bacterium]|jgi:sorbitol-specific phosphotransferase system component IIBC|nr:hypothetical protein [Clostridia bacterium]